REPALAIADPVVAGFDGRVLDYDLSSCEAERILLARIDVDGEAGRQRAPLRDAAARVRLHRDGAGLPEDHRAATRLGEHELRAVLPGTIENEVDRGAAAPAADDRDVGDELRRIGPGAVERMAVHPGCRRPRVAHLQDHTTIEREPDEVLQAARVVGVL